MPDVGLQDVPDVRRRVCVIGAGYSGLVAAKVFAARGRDVTIFEKSLELGGVWAPDKSYPGVRTQTPRDLYCFSDFPMPAEYPEWPTGTQVHHYLCDYANRFGLLPLIRFGTGVLRLAQAASGWTVEVSDAGGQRTERFDEVVVATGQFSSPKTLGMPGRAAFEQAGGRMVHSSQHRDDADAAGRDVVVLGYSKSATDLAMQALAARARSVTMVYREATWKLPYFFGNRVNFKNILFCRASEAMFMPWAPSRWGRFARRVMRPAIWANWRALEVLLDVQFGLTRKGLRPSARIEDGIHCATSMETPGFFKAVGQGDIRMVRGTLAAAEPGHVVTDGGERLPAGLVVLAIGWTQEVPFLDEAARAKLVSPDGQYQLFRMLVNPDLPDLGFVGFNSSFVTPLSAEIGAHWLVRYFDGVLARMPDRAAMEHGIGTVAEWKRTHRLVATGYGGLCVAPYHHEHFDELMRDMGARHRGHNLLTSTLLPISPKAYAPLLASVADASPLKPEPVQ